MILKRIYLKNFLTHTETEINFPDRGIIVFIGENGAGKSSIIEGISFALFGKTTKGYLQDAVQWGKNESKVELDFIKHNEIYRIERVISIKGKKALSSGIIYKKIGESFLPYYQKNITREIPKLIGLTSKTFFSSVLIRQGEIENLIDMKPRERAKLFEEILDMTLYQMVAELAGEKRRSLESQVKLVSSTVPDVQAIYEDLKNLKSTMLRVKKNRESLQRKKETLESNIQDLRKKYETDLNEKEKILKIYHKIDIIEEKIKSYEKDIKNREEELTEIKNKEKEITSLKPFVKRYEKIENILDLFRQLEAENEKLRTLEDRIKEIEERKKIKRDLKDTAHKYEEKEKYLKEITAKLNEMSKLKGELNSFEDRTKELKKKLSETMKDAQEIALELTEFKKIYRILFDNPVAINQFIANCEQDISKLEEEIKKTIKEKAEIEAEGKELKRKKEKIDSLEGSCPTCERPLDTHSKEEILKEIEQKLQLLRNRYRKVKDQEKKLSQLLKREKYIKEKLLDYKDLFTKHKEAESELLKIRSKLFVNQKKIKEFEGIERERSEIEKFLSENRDLYLSYKEAENFLSRVDPEKIKKELNKVKEKIRTLNRKLKNEDQKKIKEEYQDLKKKVERYFSIKEQVARKDQLKKEIKELKAEIKKLSEEKRSLKKSVKDLNQLETDLNRIRSEIESKETELKSIIEEKSEIEKEITRLETEIQLKEKEIKKTEEIKKDLQKTKEKIEKYRKIERALGPDGIQKIIRDTALHELPKLTNQIFSIFGFPFQQVKFSEDFDITLLAPSLEKKDRLISVNALSGGQKTALGIALRLAIGRFLSSKNEMLILDEPTVHLDDQRRSELINLLLELRRKKFVNQLIIVTHDTEVEDAADNIYYVENGTVRNID
ncbi:AAA family ATPase [Persephonella sp.]